MPAFPFPPVSQADASGLLAAGGELTPEQVWLAHQSGVFPWYCENTPILWWAPNPRAIIPTNRLHISRSLAKTLRSGGFRITYDTAFTAVVEYCAQVHGESWITAAVKAAYTALYEEGRAHSCELWIDGELKGGLYGVCLDRVFCGESMFSLVPSASKIVLAELCAHLHRCGITVLDTQFLTPHLVSMGALEIPRDTYQTLLGGNPDRLRGRWT